MHVYVNIYLITYDINEEFHTCAKLYIVSATQKQVHEQFLYYHILLNSTGIYITIYSVNVRSLITMGTSVNGVYIAQIWRHHRINFTASFFTKFII